MFNLAFRHLNKLFSGRPEWLKFFNSTFRPLTSSSSSTLANPFPVTKQTSRSDQSIDSSWQSTSTIFSLATTFHRNLPSPVAIVRVSGKQSQSVLQRLTAKHSKCFRNPRTAVFSSLINPKSEDILDQSLVIWFPKPHSYTGEDMCEFHVHGSVAIVSSLLDCIGSLSGVRPAEAGEFTRRAFLNDKLNLIQAEAVGALIDSRTDSQRRHALNELSESNISSTTTAKYQRWADQMLLFVAYMEAYIEFGEDQLLNEQKIEMELDKLRSLRQEIRSYLHTASRTGDLIRHGVNVTILGQPNVGKSSLINKLCEKELAIVSPTAGTTRDVIESQLNIGGYAVNICDTAGIRETGNDAGDKNRSMDQIEQEGIKRAMQKAKTADIILCVIDAQSLQKRNQLGPTFLELHFQSLMPLDRIRQRESEEETNSIAQRLFVINKCDLIEESAYESMIGGFFKDKSDVIGISCTSELNLETLLERLETLVQKVVNLDGEAENEQTSFITQRHCAHLNEVIEHLDFSERFYERDLSISAFHLRNAVQQLGQITGQVSNEQILDVIFRDFCIGK